MLKEKAKILNVSQSNVVVQVTRQKMCSCCPISTMCSNTNQTLTIENVNLDLTAGDNVEIGIEDKKNFIAVLTVFLIPCLIFVAMLIFFKPTGEIKSFFFAVSALVIYFLTLKILLKRKAGYFNVKILRKLNDEYCGFSLK